MVEMVAHLFVHVQFCDCVVFLGDGFDAESFGLVSREGGFE